MFYPVCWFATLSNISIYLDTRCQFSIQEKEDLNGSFLNVLFCYTFCGTKCKHEGVIANLYHHSTVTCSFSTKCALALDCMDLQHTIEFPFILFIALNMLNEKSLGSHHQSLTCPLFSYASGPSKQHYIMYWMTCFNLTMSRFATQKYTYLLSTFW